MGTSDTLPTPEHDQIAALRALVDEQKAQNTGLTARIKILEEQLRLATVKTFAPFRSI